MRSKKGRAGAGRGILLYIRTEKPSRLPIEIISTRGAISSHFLFFFSSSFLRHSTGLPPFLIAIHQNHTAMTPSPNRRRRNNYGTREAKSRIKADVVVIVALPADYPPPPPHPCSYTAELLYQPVNVDPAYIALVTVPASWNGYRAVSMLIQRLP